MYCHKLFYYKNVESTFAYLEKRKNLIILFEDGNITENFNWKYKNFNSNLMYVNQSKINFSEGCRLGHDKYQCNERKNKNEATLFQIIHMGRKELKLN